ncbi:MAG: hypothetical protein HKM04_09375 [Legionellales bacterium]|nr:hypothetical protein [Legionellales bacterium]
MTENEKQQIFLELQNELHHLQLAEMALSISRKEAGFVFSFNGVKEKPLLLELLTDLNDERIEIKQENAAVNVQIPYDFMLTDKGLKIRSALPLLITLQSLKNKAQTMLASPVLVVTSTFDMIKAIVNDSDCSPKAATLTFEAFHPPVKRIAQDKPKPLTPQETKVFDERIHYAAREGRMAESTKNKIFGAALLIPIGLIFAATISLAISFPVFFPVIMIGGLLASMLWCQFAVEKGYDKFLGLPRDSDTPKKETIKARDSIVNWGIFKDTNKQLDKTSATKRTPPNPNDFGVTDALAASAML